MVLGIIGLFTFFLLVPSLLAIIFGLVAARQIKRSTGMLTGGGLARAGWIMGIIGLLASGAFFAAGVTGNLDDGETPVFDVEVGECVDFDFDLESERSVEITTVDVVDCDDEHDAEAIRAGELNPDGDREYPSSDVLFAETAAACGRRGPDILTVAPNEDSWEEDGGPFICFAISAD